MGRGAFRRQGVGELPMDGGAPAVVQAIENATGIDVPEIPATPEKLLRWSLTPVPSPASPTPLPGRGAPPPNQFQQHRSVSPSPREGSGEVGEGVGG